MFVGKLGTFVAFGVKVSRMIDNCSFNLGEFYVKMGKTNRKLRNFNNAESLFYIISDIETVVYESAHFQYKNLSDRYSNNM